MLHAFADVNYFFPAAGLAGAGFGGCVFGGGAFGGSGFFTSISKSFGRGSSTNSPLTGCANLKPCSCLHEPEIDDDLADALDGVRAWQDKQMETWRVETRVQLEAMALTFPLTLHAVMSSS